MTRRRYEIISTVFDKRGRVLATATNDYKRSHPLFKHFAVLAGESPDKHYRQACLKIVWCKDCSLYYFGRS